MCADNARFCEINRNSLVREEIKDRVRDNKSQERRKGGAISTPGKRIILILAQRPPYSSTPLLIRAGAALSSDRSPEQPFRKAIELPFSACLIHEFAFERSLSER